MARLLNPSFIADLTNGKLKHILDFVHMDDTLDLQIRDNYVNIYYRGGNVLKIKQAGTKYSFHFDEKYLNIPGASTQVSLKLPNSEADCFLYFSLAKQIMDVYFTIHRKEEREYQQMVVRENNYSSIANSTDYFIVDIEYDNHNNARFDLIALEWPSISSHRKLASGYRPKLHVIEMKYGDGALEGSAGMKKHCNDFKSFFNDVNNKTNFTDEMTQLFQQKRELNLIPCLAEMGNTNKVIDVQPDIDLCFLIANHDPDKSKLDLVIESSDDCNSKFFLTSYAGYGLFKDFLIDRSKLDKIKCILKSTEAVQK